MTNNQQKLLEIFSEISNTDVEVNLETKIDALDLDSLETMDLLMLLENEFKLEIAIDKFSLCTDIGSVYKIIEPS